jgi:hypothetical protein
MDFDLPYVWTGFFLDDSVPKEASTVVVLILLMCSADDELEDFGGAVGNDETGGDPKWARWAASIVLFKESVV